MTRCVCATLLVAALSLAVRGANDSPALTLARQLNDAFVEVAEKVSPSVVVIKLAHKPGSIDIDDEDNPFWEFVPKEFRKQFEQEREKRRKRPDADEQPDRAPVFDSQGSGVIIRDDGYILTNFHVVEDAEKIRVRLRDGRTFEGTVRGKDSRSDLAVIKINATNLPAAKLGDSAAVRVGEFAIAIGAPFELDYSVTFGHVSAKGRSRVVPSFGVTSPGAMMDQDFIQTDASINPGNSGGPLVNLYGEVIGINTLIRGLHTGIGFAVPVNMAKDVSDKLISDGRYSRLWLGVSIRGLREDEDDTDKIKINGVEDGVLVTDIQADGPASKSDLRRRDVIIAVDGKNVMTANQLRNEIRGKKAGNAVTLDVVRQSKPLKVKVHPEAWPESAEPKKKKSGEVDKE
jgi:serine protease Do